MSEELEFILTLLSVVSFCGLMAITYLVLEWICLWVRGDEDQLEFLDWVNRPF